jgi:hypothetical protein
VPAQKIIIRPHCVLLCFTVLRPTTPPQTLDMGLGARVETPLDSLFISGAGPACLCEKYSSPFTTLGEGSAFFSVRDIFIPAFAVTAEKSTHLRLRNEVKSVKKTLTGEKSCASNGTMNPSPAML